MRWLIWLFPLILLVGCESSTDDTPVVDIPTPTAPDPVEPDPVDPNNKAPVVLLGNDQTLAQGKSILLMGAVSDPEGDSVSLKWQALQSSAVEMLTQKDGSLRLSLPDTTSALHKLAFRLTATDEHGNFGYDDIWIHAVSEKPAYYPLIPEMMVSYQDQDPTKGELSALGVLQRATDESEIVEYAVYWSDKLGARLSGGSLARFDKPMSVDETLVFAIPANSDIPEGASHFLVEGLDADHQVLKTRLSPILDSHFDAMATGPGGNFRTGKVEYGPLGTGMRVAKTEENGKSFCVFDNGLVQVHDMGNQKDTRDSKSADDQLFPPYRFECDVSTRNTYREYTNHFFDDVSDYGPLNDSFAGASTVYTLLQQYMQMPPLEEPIRIRTHYDKNWENAGWDSGYVDLGDGYINTFALTDLETLAHEISHAVTDRFAHLASTGRDRTISEGFSDIAAIAIESAYYGKTDFLYEEDIMQWPMYEAARFFKEPTKNSQGSIDHLSDYDSIKQPYEAIGLITKPFYLLATTSDWTVEKAFRSFLWANVQCWQAGMTFEFAAQCVKKGAEAFQYPGDDVARAFGRVGIEIPGNASYADFSWQRSFREVQFQDISKGQTSATSWQWNFGDGSTSTEQNPKHIYTSDADERLVQLTVADGVGQQSTFQQSLFVSEHYCVGVTSPDLIHDHWISRVVVGQLDKSSGAASYTPPNPTPEAALEIGKEISVTLTAGGEYDPKAFASSWRIWVDLNRDGQFSDQEVLVDKFLDKNPLTTKMTIPQGTSAGKTAMRVVFDDDLTLFDACGAPKDGEIEDFYVTLVEPSAG